MTPMLPGSALALVLSGGLTGSALAGAPLKGVDVKLGKPPGGTPVASRVTDKSGKFDFGILAKGSYRLTVTLPEGTAGSGAVSLIIKGVPTANISRIIRIGAPDAKVAGQGGVMEFTADGVHPVAGRISTADAATE